MSEELKDNALRYHAAEPAGKLAISPTKPMASQQDLALAYSPGVAYACTEIAEYPASARKYTAKGNLVAVISNGTAVLGLGNIGAQAAKPVMEGKAVLFKKFSGIDVFDLEIDEQDPDRLVDIIASLEPTFGGVNLEDISAPTCFAVEEALKERMNIPVFHDDQHGTAIVASTAVKNWLRVVSEDISKVRMVCSGAGAAAIACLNLLLNMGMRKENIYVFDRSGLIHVGRNKLAPHKARFAQTGNIMSLEQACRGANIFLGVSGPGALSPEALRVMAADPLVLALANPTPEITPEEARTARNDVIIATGRSDYPNQVNNVLCFPFIFRGALDCGATTINEEMKVACVQALSDLAMAEPSEIVALAYASEQLRFGPDYLIPKPLDPRLITYIAPAVVQAAVDSGVATRPIEDIEAYRRSLARFVFQSGRIMEPFLERASKENTRIVYAEGEEPRILRAVQQIVDSSVTYPILVGRPDVVRRRVNELGLSMNIDSNIELVNPESDPRFREYWSLYHRIMGRRGVSPAIAQTVVRGNNTVIAALMCKRGEADGMICGTTGRFEDHLEVVSTVIGKAPDIRELSTISALILPTGTIFICDSHISHDPSAEELAEMTLLAASEVRHFGIEPKVALVSRSQFGSHNYDDAVKMREALAILGQREPQLCVDGEMQADSAVSESIRTRSLGDCALTGKANLLIMPNVDAAHISASLLKELGGGVAVGPLLIGAALPVNVLTESVTARGIVNMTAITAVQVQEAK
ncbi:MAG: NADP-dependent malic enzyme [Gammaproteobacteria bacterium]|nr:NADP-dependent malic enzyme [Gammaproteobacteria bacterium]